MFFNEVHLTIMTGVSLPPGKLAVNYIAADGGPAILLQETAAAHWEGATEDYGNRETDYDIACNAEEWCIHRYERDMIVFADEEGWVVPLPSGDIAISQRDTDTDAILESVQTFLNDPAAHESFPFHIQDTKLRFLPAGDDGNGSIYGYVEIPVYPGIWTVHVSGGEERTLLVLSPPAVPA